MTTRRNVLLGMVGLFAAACSPPPGPGGRGSGTVVCICAHPDDAESGCGGTLIRLVRSGYHVKVIYTFAGGIPGKRGREVVETRREEAKHACHLMGAEPIFLFDENGTSKLDTPWLPTLVADLKKADPEMIFAHWSMDSHPDHQMAALLAFRAAQGLDALPEMYFFEVEHGRQTMAFDPSVYVDITAVRADKVKALMAHESQDPMKLYKRDHEQMELFRGREAGYGAAEAFIPLRAGYTRLTDALD
ncbi:PIG-L family deacetylase [Pendulispora rubella]|uniref:PIG-L family deacetylase n=1 Tax=Pendulispora rubella TaxID=2741070 RepID=A0ABZ2L3T2_9BACT